MKKILKQENVILAIVMAGLIALCISSLFLYSRKFYYSSFLVWLLSIFVSFIFVNFKLIIKTKNKKIPIIFNKANLAFFTIVLTGFLLRIIAIDTVPILTHDEGKDVGLLPLMVMSHELNDYFGFYQSLNNFLFVLGSIPHYFISNHMYSARILGVLTGTGAIVLLYVLTKKLYSIKVALISSFILASNQIHIHFSRVQFVTILDSFYVLVVAIYLYTALRVNKLFSVLFLGIILGIGTHFYSGLRATILITVIFFLAKQLLSLNLKRIFIQGLTLVTGLFIGLGPLLYVFIFRPEESLARGSALFVIQNGKFTFETVIIIAELYFNSLLAYVLKPIDFQYNYGGPLIMFPFSLLFIIGLIILLLKIKEKLNFYFLLLLLGIPLVNSGILYNINNAHRLLSLVPVISIVMALGLVSTVKLIGKISYKLSVSFLILILVSFLFYNSYIYFYKNVWEKALYINEFIAWTASNVSNKYDPKKTQILFLGTSNYPSYRSVPSFNYLTNKFLKNDVNKLEDINLILNNYNYDILLIVLPNSQLDGKNFIPGISLYGRHISRYDAYYKNSFMFHYYYIKKERGN
jgi:4-amino-4-deoxy-L-arabinose transferase-like glycosyltransferase